MFSDMAARFAADHDHLGDVHLLLQFSGDWNVDNEDSQPMVHQGRVLQDRFGGPESSGWQDNVPRLCVHHL